LTNLIEKGAPNPTAHTRLNEFSAKPQSIGDR